MENGERREWDEPSLLCRAPEIAQNDVGYRSSLSLGTSNPSGPQYSFHWSTLLFSLLSEENTLFFPCRPSIRPLVFQVVHSRFRVLFRERIRRLY